MKETTSWENSANWYVDLLRDPRNTYQGRLILPNLLRLMNIKKGEPVLDLACGQGFFSREFFKSGARVIGVDLSDKLVEIAKKESPKEIDFHVSDASSLPFVEKNSTDKVVIVLSIQNMKDLNPVLKECGRVLKSKGKLLLVLNHPAFRTPHESSWGYDEEKKVQFRRINRYLSELKSEIKIHPGGNPKEVTLSFHRPLQSYFKSLEKNGFAVSRLEEWNSDKKSESGPRARAEDVARKEIPLFLFLESVLI